MHKQPVASDDVLTLEEAAKFLKVSSRTVWQLATADRLPYFRIGSQLRFLRAELMRYAEEGGGTHKGEE